MKYAQQALPEPQAILRAWLPFKQLVGVTSVRTEEDYDRATAMIDSLLDEVGDDENHPLADLLDYYAEQVKAWEDENVEIPEAEPSEVLRFLMDQHGSRNDDLRDCAPPDAIDGILQDRQPISKDIAKRLARRFHLHAEAFL